MKKETKKSFLQIRVSCKEKDAICKSAKNAGMDMSQWVLSCILPKKQKKFQNFIQELKINTEISYTLAELNDFLSSLNVNEFKEICKETLDFRDDAFLQNYVTAMIEETAFLKHTIPPKWTEFIVPLDIPYFPTELKSLRLYLLANARIPFRRRNLFVDTSIGGRV